MHHLTLSIALVFSLGLCLSAGCGDDDGHGAHCTTEGEKVCVGDTQYRTCDGDHLGEIQDCPEGQGCHTMDSGLTHCMPLGMMGGGDDDPPMDHDAHGAMGDDAGSMAMDHDGHGPMEDDAGSMSMGDM